MEDEAGWDFIAHDIASRLEAGDVITLQGPLGAGKTTFVQSLARALGIKKTPQSPTFSLMRTYVVPKHPRFKRLVHMDAYRIDDESDLLALDLDSELHEPGTLLVIEWPEKIPTFLKGKSVTTLKVRL